MVGAAGATAVAIGELGSSIAYSKQSQDEFNRQHKGTPGNNQAQNKQFNDVVKKLNLNKWQQCGLHDRILKKNYSYKEILEIGREMFGK